MLNKYYQEELTYLRDLGSEFAREYPNVARYLGQSGVDPDVERLLEGFAFLTGRVRQKLDDEFPEIIHSVATLLFPHLLRPVPAASILEITPRNTLRNRRVVDAGAEFRSVLKDGTGCVFSATNACEVMPWKIEGVRLMPGQNGKHLLRFTLNLFAGLTLAQIAPERVRLHVFEETRIALLLTYYVVEHWTKVTFTAHAANAKAPEASETIDRSSRRDALDRKRAVVHVGFEDEEALLPLTEHVMPGFRLVEEYFLLPNKFAFFEIGGLQKIAASAPKATSIEVTIELDRQPPIANVLKSDCLKLHCVPVVNVFKSTARSVSVDQERESYPLKPEDLPPDRGSIYAVLDIVGRERGSDKRLAVKPFFDFAHADDPDNSLCYVTHLRPDTLRNEAEQHVSLKWSEADRMRRPTTGNVVQHISVDRPGSDKGFGVGMVLSIDILATNGPLGSEVRAGEIKVPTSTSPAFADFQNLTAATPYVPVQLGDELHWRVMAHIATGLRTLADPNVLRAALRIYNLHGLVDHQSRRAAENRIDAIRTLSVGACQRLHRGAAVRGISVEIELDESGFAGEGDLYLFGAVLNRLFASYVPINSFAATTVTGLTTRARTEFPPSWGGVEII
ncbi:MAG TPA: type VI secretion system baseplate subunit TssF [Polyangiaceae bacterium]|nr:type VI secretion system baseplate subunit TssF [Polyangiaceae bacterium]